MWLSEWAQSAQHSRVIRQIPDSPATGGRCFLLETLRKILWCGQSCFVCFFNLVCKEFEKNVMAPFLSPPLPSCPLTTGLFPSAFELGLWQSMASAGGFLAFAPAGATRSPSCCEADGRDGGQKMEAHQSTPVCWAFFFKALGIRLTFQLWKCARLIIVWGWALSLRRDLFVSCWQKHTPGKKKLIRKWVRCIKENGPDVFLNEMWRLSGVHLTDVTHESIDDSPSGSMHQQPASGYVPLLLLISCWAASLNLSLKNESSAWKWTLNYTPNGKGKSLQCLHTDLCPNCGNLTNRHLFTSCREEAAILRALLLPAHLFLFFGDRVFVVVIFFLPAFYFVRNYISNHQKIAC